MSFKYSSKYHNSFSYVTEPNQIKKKDEKFFSARGDSFMLKNEYRKAVKEYLVSLMIEKNNLPAYKGASKAYKNLQEYDKAIKHLKSARSVYGFDSEVYYELGLNYLLNSDNLNAQKNFIRTIKLQPENKNAQIKLALTHELSGEDDMATLVYSTIIEKNPNYIPAFSSLAGLYVEHENFLEAVKLYKEILRINSEYYRAHLGLGICFDKLNKPHYAIRHYKKYIVEKPKSDTSMLLAKRIVELYKSIKESKKRKNDSRKAILKIVSNNIK